MTSVSVNLSWFSFCDLFLEKNWVNSLLEEDLCQMFLFNLFFRL